MFTRKICFKNKIVVVGSLSGYIEASSLKTFQIFKSFNAHNKSINCLELDKNKNIIASASNNQVKFWNLTSFELIKLLEVGFLIFDIKIVKQKVYLSLSESPIQVLDLETLTKRGRAQCQLYFVTCLSISISLGLIAYGYSQVNLYKLKTQEEICSRSLGNQILSLAFIKSYILCGTSKGQVFYLDSSGLVIKKCLHLAKGLIRFVSSSMDFNFLAYSANNKSFVLDFEKKGIIFNSCVNIIAGVFIEDQKKLVLNCGNYEYYILKNYIKLVKIIDQFLGYQIMKSATSNYCVIKTSKSLFVLLNLKTKLIDDETRLRKLKRGTLKYSKEVLIVSCLDYSLCLNL